MTRAISDQNSHDLRQSLLSAMLTVPLSITKWMGQSLLKRHKIQNQNSDSDNFETYFNELLPSVDEPLCEFSGEKPEWFDAEKFARGRVFAMKHILGLLYAEELSVVLLMSLPILRGPLIFSGQSDSPEKAFRRYLSTVERVMSWYSQDIWDKDSTAHHNLMVVRGMHNRVTKDMQSCTSAQQDKKIEQFEPATTEFLTRLRADLEDYLPDAVHEKWLQRFQAKKGPYINQSGMTLTQIGFIALLILEPRKFGAPRATPDELDDFVYVWYVLGHQLGIADRYNICAGGLNESRRRCKLLLRHLVLPSLATAGYDWEHMSRCVVSAVHRMIRQTPFEAAVAYSLQALDVQTPHIDSLIPWKELPRVWLFKWVLSILLGIPGFPHFFGTLLKVRLCRLRRRLDSSKV